jgi:hypothetical protein
MVLTRTFPLCKIRRRSRYYYLLLCEGKIAGWVVRVGHLESPLYPSNRPAIQTRGDLRSTTDAELLKEPNVGKKMVTELRRFCPPKTEETLERLFAQIRCCGMHCALYRAISCSHERMLRFMLAN